MESSSALSACRTVKLMPSTFTWAHFIWARNCTAQRHVERMAMHSTVTTSCSQLPYDQRRTQVYDFLTLADYLNFTACNAAHPARPMLAVQEVWRREVLYAYNAPASMPPTGEYAATNQGTKFLSHNKRRKGHSHAHTITVFRVRPSPISHERVVVHCLRHT